MSDSVSPHRQQPTRLPRPWDSPGKNTGVGCHCLLQCMKVKSESEVAQLCPTPSDPMDCSLPASSIHGIYQERVLEWGAIAFSNIDLYYLYNREKTTMLFSLWKWKLLSCVWLCDPMDCRNSPGQNTGVGSPLLLQGLFPIQGSNTGLPHCK